MQFVRGHSSGTAAVPYLRIARTASRFTALSGLFTPTAAQNANTSISDAVGGQQKARTCDERGEIAQGRLHLLCVASRSRGRCFGLHEVLQLAVSALGETLLLLLLADVDRHVVAAAAGAGAVDALLELALPCVGAHAVG